MCLGPPIEPPTEQSRRVVNSLKIMLIVLLILAGMKLLGMNYGWVSDLIGVFLLYQAMATLDFCSTVVFIFYSTMNVVNALMDFGLLWQNEVSLTSANTYAVFVGIVSLIVYVFAIVIAFYAYREFKALAMEMSGGNQSTRQNELSNIPAASNNYQGYESNYFLGPGTGPGTGTASNNQAFTPYTGKGVMIGEP